MKSIQFVTGKTLDLRNVIAIDGGNAYLFLCATSDVGKKLVIDIGRRRKMPFYVKEMYLILHFKEHCEIERLEPGEINLCNYIRSKGYIADLWIIVMTADGTKKIFFSTI